MTHTSQEGKGHQKGSTLQASGSGYSHVFSVEKALVFGARVGEVLDPLMGCTDTSRLFGCSCSVASPFSDNRAKVLADGWAK